MSVLSSVQAAPILGIPCTLVIRASTQGEHHVWRHTRTAVSAQVVGVWGAQFDECHGGRSPRSLARHSQFGVHI